MRLFVGVALPSEIGKELAFIRSASELPRLNWIPPKSLHLTLAFLGAVTPSECAAAREALDAIRDRSTFSMRLRGGGVFPSERRARIFWAGVDDATPLTGLAEAVRSELRRRRVHFDEKPFRPHVSVARSPSSRAPGDQFVKLLSSYHSSPFTVDAVRLFESLTDRGGVRYESLQISSLRCA